MPKDPSPLLGYNNNIRHKNRVFHIQTEDSGVRHPHIITHLFMDGGRILKSVKTSYAEHLGVEKMADMVRKMMKDQHKGMLIALRDGQFDVVIDGGEPSKPGLLPPPPSSAPAVVSKVPSVPPPPEATAPELPPEPSQPPEVPTSVPEIKQIPASVRPRTPVSSRPVAQASARDLDLPPVSRPFEAAPSDLEPPPANLFRPRTGGNYSTLDAHSDPDPRSPSHASRPAVPSSGRPITRPPTSPPGATISKSGTKPVSVPPRSPTGAPASPSVRPVPIRRTSSPPAPPVAPGTPSPPGSPANRIVRRPNTAPVVVAKAPESRYASARPAAIFGQARPRGGSSIFGEDIISDKSLDEVIMSYLADDSKDSSPNPSSPPGSDPKRRK